MEEFGFRLELWVPEVPSGCVIRLSENGIAAWQAGIASYASQISTFWQSSAEMQV
jgi:hypothetical protein